jgi:DNA-binding transcriptional MerR regulator
VDETWTLPELVAEAKTRLEALPAPKNGQVRAVPDERTIRYYAALSLLDRPAAMRGRTALYGRRHLAQVVAIKRMQTAGHSLAEIQKLWPTLDDTTLSRITGVLLDDAAAPRKGRGRKEFWKREAEALPPPPAAPLVASPVPVLRAQAPASHSTAPAELRLELAPGVTVSIALPANAPVSLSPDDVRALRAAAAPLVSELAHRGLT